MGKVANVFTSELFPLEAHTLPSKEYTHKSYLKNFIFEVSIHRPCETTVTNGIDDNVSVRLGTWFHEQLWP